MHTHKQHKSNSDTSSEKQTQNKEDKLTNSNNPFFSLTNESQSVDNLFLDNSLQKKINPYGKKSLSPKSNPFIGSKIQTSKNPFLDATAFSNTAENTPTKQSLENSKENSSFKNDQVEEKKEDESHSKKVIIQEKKTQTIQRLPTRNQVIGEVGEPKANAKKSLRYKSFLNYLSEYNTAINKIIGKSAAEIDEQANLILTKLNYVIASAHHYNERHHTDQRAKLITALKLQAELEKSIIKTRATYFKNNLINHPYKNKMWFQAIPDDLGTRIKNLTAATQIGNAQGGINTVAEHQLGDYKGFFKEDKNQITNEAELGQAEDLGIPTNNPHFANRSMAMYRIDRLLGGNIIARTEFATQQGIKGTISQKANGTKLAELGNANQLNINDAVLQRCLSKLDIIDAICYQIDRHGGNLYIQRDNHNQIIGITGIDNDAAFPSIKGPQDKFKKVTSVKNEFNGVSRYFDKEMAEMVLALEEDDLKAVLTGLLSESEISFTIERLRDLKVQINAAKGNNELLSPNEWNAATALAQKNALKGYTAKFN